MRSFIPVFIILGVLSAILLIGAINWYRMKEIREKRSLDLQILALDNGAKFKETDFEFESRVTYFIEKLKLGFPRPVKIRNVISKQHPNYESTFFDIEIPKGGKTNEIILKHGVFVKLNHSLPVDFRIGQKGLWDRFCFSGYRRIESYLNPAWMPEDMSVFSAREDQKVVHTLISQQHALAELIIEKRFHSMIAHDKYVILIYAGQRPADLAQYQMQSIRAAKIARTFATRLPEDDIQITALKATA